MTLIFQFDHILTTSLFLQHLLSSSFRLCYNMMDLYFNMYLNSNVYFSTLPYLPINYLSDNVTSFMLIDINNLSKNFQVNLFEVNPNFKFFTDSLTVYYEFYTLTLYINYYLWVYILIAFFSYNFFFKNIFNFSTNFFFLNSLTELEKELNSIDDLIYIVFLFLGLFTYNFFFFGLFINIQNFNILIFCFIYNVQAILVFIPLSLILDYGFYFIIYIRGSTSSSLVLYEIILDYINIVAYFLRIIIQLVRIVVILVTFFTFSELYLEYYYYFYKLFLSNAFYNSSNSYSLIIFGFLFILHWLFEFLHLIFIFLLQTAAFNVMILWLFQFLFTLFFYELLEIFFFKYRK